jgi:hypothetical protein
MKGSPLIILTLSREVSLREMKGRDESGKFLKTYALKSNYPIKQGKKEILMLYGQKVFFRASKADLDRLYACNQESAPVWNECLRLAKEHFLQYGCRHS